MKWVLLRSIERCDRSTIERTCRLIRPAVKCVSINTMQSNVETSANTIEEDALGDTFKAVCVCSVKQSQVTITRALEHHIQCSDGPFTMLMSLCPCHLVHTVLAFLFTQLSIALVVRFKVHFQFDLHRVKRKRAQCPFDWSALCFYFLLLLFVCLHIHCATVRRQTDGDSVENVWCEEDDHSLDVSIFA